MRRTTSKIRNIKKYLLAALFNAPCTMNTNYAQEINHTYGALPSDVQVVPDVLDDF
jgi:hypothetical protein